MRTRLAWLIVFLSLMLGGFATWSLLRGQAPAGLRLEPLGPAAGPAAPPTAPAVMPRATTSAPPVSSNEDKSARVATGRDLSKLSPLQRQMYLSVLSAADWLHRANRDDGRFVYGYLPAVNLVMEGDHYLRQAGAAVALARAARFISDKDYTARATQAVLTLLSDTTTDPREPEVRYTSLPSSVINRLAAAGLLVLAVNELPAPQDDLLKQSEQLCNYIRKQQRPDGSLSYADGTDSAAGAADVDGINYYPGEALYGLMSSQQHRPAPWKTELVRKALDYYRPWWRAHKSPAFIPWQTAAYTAAYLQTKDQVFADYVYEMNDWLCGLQYERLDPRRPLWVGGFMGWVEGKRTETAPDVSSATYAEGLAEACRVARATGDLLHYRRYDSALERALQFLATLQYTEANTQHFAAWYRRQLVGAFHASDQDGNLRIDYTQHAACAMIEYLDHVAR
jgi:hypothetical protein